MCRVHGLRKVARVSDGLEISVGTTHLTGGSIHRREKMREDKAPGSDGIWLEVYKAK